MDLLLVRHALPDRIEDADRADPGLSEVGRAQAVALADAWAPRGVDAVLSSPARRARETATPLAERLGLEVPTDERLHEFDWGDRSYVPYEQLRREDPDAARAVDARLTADDDATRAWRASVTAALDEVVAAHRGQRVVVTCHGGVIASYVTSVLGDPSRADRVAVHYASVTWVLASSRGARTVRGLNDVSHLPA